MTHPVTHPVTQLVIDFPPKAAFGAQDLVDNPAQDAAQAWLARTADWPLGRLAIWGAGGSGKSHLAHAWAGQHGGTVLPAAPADPWPAQPVALDNLDTVPDEVALLHLLNAAAEARQPLLLLSRAAPSRLAVRLPDLASRLRATTAIEIGPAPDSFLQILLVRLLAERQLRIAPALQAAMLLRLPRTPAALREAVARLDAAALAAARAIDRAMIAAVAGDISASGSHDVPGIG